MEFISSLFVYFVVLLAFAIKPGPGILFFVSLTATEGAKSAVITGMGTDIGHCLILLLVMMGFELMGQYQQLTLLMQAGATLYIGYLGVAMFLKAKARHSVRTTEGASHVRRLFKGLIWAATNPANAMFYAALVPTLIAGHQELTMRSAFLIAVLTGLTFFVARIPYIYFSNKALNYFSAERVQQRVHQVSGILFISIAIGFLILLSYQSFI